MRKIVRIPMPEEFIGKWCLTTEYGTHGSYHIFSEGGMVFDTRGQAEEYNKYKHKESSLYYEIMQIEKDYPVWQTEIFICGISEKELKNMNK